MIKKIKNKSNIKVMGTITDILLIIVVFAAYFNTVNKGEVLSIIKFFMFILALIFIKLITLSWDIKTNGEYMKRFFDKFN